MERCGKGDRKGGEGLGWLSPACELVNIDFTNDHSSNKRHIRKENSDLGPLEMEKGVEMIEDRTRQKLTLKRPKMLLLGSLGLCAFYYCWTQPAANRHLDFPHSCKDNLEYGKFPRPGDPFQFLPCTGATVPPPLNDSRHRDTWAALFDPNPNHWSWGNTSSSEDVLASSKDNRDPYAGKGIYLCGYVDVPLDYTNTSDPRTARLAVTKYQVSGLAHRSNAVGGSPSSGQKSQRTLILEPGGPGGSGTSFVWRGGESQTSRLSAGKYDVLGWDPRGVNVSLPSAACFPYDADRDRWTLLTTQYWASVNGSPSAQLRLADAMNNATFAACKDTLGDIPRFLGTAFVARDLEEIRIALDEPDVTGYFVSYGTGIGQTYANMFPQRVGNLILDGTEYVRDHRALGGFGWTALDNATDAWNDGFLGECVNAGPEHCALAAPQSKDANITLDDLKTRMSALLDSIKTRPLPALTQSSGPSLITYSAIVGVIYSAMYSATAWPALAQGLYDLEHGNTTMVARMLDSAEWEFDPTTPCRARSRSKPSSDELTALVVCADSYDAPMPPIQAGDPDGLGWWSSLWHNMTSQNWIAGDSRFYTVLPCRHYTEYFGPAAEVYRGDLNHTLSNPVLLIAETYDPATPLRNGRRLLHEMGDNARLVVHHGYGHSSRDSSECTDEMARNYILHGTVPRDSETACYADGKPFLYDNSTLTGKASARYGEEEELLMRTWREHMRDLSTFQPRLGLSF